MDTDNTIEAAELLDRIAALERRLDSYDRWRSTIGDELMTLAALLAEELPYPRWAIEARRQPSKD